MAEVKNFVLGRGRLYFNQFANGTQTLTGERYIGSTQQFSLAIGSETLNHMSMESGIRSIDDSAILENTRNASYTTDQIDQANLSSFIVGEGETLAVAGGAVVDELISGVTQNRHYQLGYDEATNITGARNVSAVTVTDDNATPVTFTETTDYTVDLDLGRIYVVEGGAITDGTNLKVSYTEAAYSREQIVTSDNTKLYGALRFVADNAKGENRDFYMPYVLMTPNGEYALKGDDWQNMGFNLSILQKSATIEAIYADGRPYTP